MNELKTWQKLLFIDLLLLPLIYFFLPKEALMAFGGINSALFILGSIVWVIGEFKLDLSNLSGLQRLLLVDLALLLPAYLLDQHLFNVYLSINTMALLISAIVWIIRGWIDLDHMI